MTEATVSTVPKSVAARAARKRFSFGAVWNAAVVAGTATDMDKLVAQGVKLKVGAKSDLKRLKLATLRAKVAATLSANERFAVGPATAPATASTEVI